MSRTFQNVVDRARVPLNDSAKTRYPDADLVAYANDATLLLRAKRPDLFFGTFNSLPSAEYVLGNPIPFDDMAFPMVCDYVTARAMHRDDEQAMQAMAATFFGLWGGNYPSMSGE